MMADRNVQNSDFKTLCERIKNLDVRQNQELNHLLDQLNSLNYQTILLEDEVMEKLLQHIVTLIPEKNDHILSKFCFLVQIFFHRLKGISLSQECAEYLLKYVLKSAQSCGRWVYSDVLFALSCLLYKLKGISKEVSLILLSPSGLLLPALSVNSDISVQYSSLKCLYSVTSRYPADCREEFFQDVCTSCISCLESNISSVESISNCKVLIFALKCLENVLASKSVMIDHQLGEFLGTIKALLYCGFPGQPALSAVVLYPTLINLYTPDQEQSHEEDSKKLQKRKAHRIRPRKKNTGKKQNDKKKDCEAADAEDNSNLSDCSGHSSSILKFSETTEVKEWGLTSSSESDFSDVEDSAVKIRQLHTSIRQHAYNVLQAIMKTVDKKTMFGYWSSFLPHCASAEFGVNSLSIFTTILKDPSPKVRLCAVGVLSEILRGSKPYLSLVDDRTTNVKSFISASSVLTSMVNELHRCLLLALVSETSHSLLTQILKCYAILIENVPYKRLKQDLLLRPVKHLKHLLNHKDVQVQVACLTVFGSILNSDHIPEEILMQFISSNASSLSSQASNFSITRTCNNNDDDVNVTDLPWIVSVCKENVTNKNLNQPLPVVVESLQVLAVISGKYFNVVRPLISVVQEVIQVCFHDTHCFLQLHGAKLLEVIGRALLSELNEKPSTSSPDTLQRAFSFWNEIFGGKFPSCLTSSEQDTSRTVCCDCLSTVPPCVFDKLPKNIQVFCISLLFGLSSESDHNVRGAAVRCIGVYTLFPCFQDDFSFLDDSARILVEAVRDDSLVVRVKASWSLGNLTDALILGRNNSNKYLREVTPDFICLLGMAAVHSSQDCDRIRASGVRALGNLLHFLPPEFLENDKVREFVKESHSALISGLSSKVMKVCWNACYALKNVLQSRHLVSSGILDMEKTFGKLMSVLKCHNFKVRINGAVALSAVPSRELYGDLFPVIFNSLIDSVSTAEADVDFKELRHFETLQNTVCHCLCQLLCLISGNDLPAVQDCSFSALEILLTSMWKFGQNADSDKISTVSASIDHLDALSGQTVDSTLLDLWKDILNQAITSFYQR